ncbi:Protein MIZU-KUSSEI 1, partial [Mucuna pruriens]
MAAKSPHDSSFSFSRRYFHWKKKALDEEDDDDDEEVILKITSSSHKHFPEDDDKQQDHHHLTLQMPSQRGAMETKKKQSKLKSALTVFTKRATLGARVVGTLFGYRRGHVHFAFQEDPKSRPAFLIELATPTSVLVREMASGLVRIALECEKKNHTNGNGNGKRLVEEPLWRTYCNGRKCGYANRRECGPHEWNILKAVEPISMGAGVLPLPGNGSEEGEIMYMRAKYERVVGSRDSEAFYMINPDGTGDHFVGFKRKSKRTHNFHRCWMQKINEGEETEKKNRPNAKE